MKFLVLALLSFSAYADIGLPGYNWNMTDIKSKGLNKEELFKSMDREFINTKSSICSNRAIMWNHNFKRDFNIDHGKIFIFYAVPEVPEEEDEEEHAPRRKKWWYHVAPIVNEAGEIWVLDAGFVNFVKRPLMPREWLHKFSKSFACKYIHSEETELVEHIFGQQRFPRTTSYGTNECYYKFVPHTLWTPESVAKNVLGRDRSGRPLRLERPEINKNELYSACLEATTSGIGRVVGRNKKKCKEYAGIVEEEQE